MVLNTHSFADQEFIPAPSSFYDAYDLSPTPPPSGTTQRPRPRRLRGLPVMPPTAGRIRTLRASLSMVREGGKGYTAQLQAGTMADAIAVLLEHHGEMQVREITAAFQDACKLHPTDAAYAGLFMTLAQDRRFEKVPGRRGDLRLA